ncbi:type II secretion system protein [Kordiimonas sediminis]|uniref:Type II secretion system protein n=1 Tax=Kordiimonas sediminis TaxID=1735581 RepID=A0A919AIT6_9PROT|nr:type II secretion system F family protein [Kordiimonas sediminis]GHF11319.1 type II secretion system protein [Kordiimonas sediminis]
MTEIFGIPTIDIISFAAGAVALLFLIVIYQASLARDPMKDRIKALQGRRDELKAGLIRTNPRKSSIKKTDSIDMLRSIADKLKLLQDEKTQQLTMSLAQAGYRSNDALVIFQISRLVMPVVMGVTGIIMFYGLNVMPDHATYHPFYAAGMVFLGFKMPDIYVTNMKQKRSDAIRLGLPDALDLLVVCAEAGLTLDSGLHRVASELGRASPELAEEFSLAAIELGFLPERKQALLNLANRIDLPTIRGVVTTLIQSEKYGTPLATSLRVLSAEFRNERMMRAEEKAARLPAILTVPLILFIMPTLFVVLMGPAACSVNDNLT